jgi:GNAT superfamily N-acetyltransferase
VIRVAALHDYAAIVNLAQRMGEEAGPPHDKNVPDLARLEHFVQKVLTAPNHVCLVYETDGRIEGFIAGATANDLLSGALYAYDHALYLAPEKRGGGGGFRLVRAFERWAASAGCKFVRIEVTANIDNAAANGVVSMAGFTPIGYHFHKDL